MAGLQAPRLADWSLLGIPAWTIADQPRLFTAAGSRTYPIKELQLWPGDRVRVHQDGGGHVDLLELRPPARHKKNPAARDRAGIDSRRVQRWAMYAPLCVSSAWRCAASLAQQPPLALEHSAAFGFSSQQASLALVEVLPSSANNAGVSTNTATVRDRSDFIVRGEYHAARRPTTAKNNFVVKRGTSPKGKS